jgi:DNA-binding transcriptional LysR family regulator
MHAILQPGGCQSVQEIAIGCFSAICRDRLADALLLFARDHPDVTVGIHDIGRAALMQALDADEITLAIVPGEPDPRLARLKLWNDRAVALLPVGHALAGTGPIAPDRLSREVFLVSADREGWSTHRFLADRVLSGAALRSRLTDAGPDRLLRSIAHGLGIALACESLVADAMPGVVARPIAGRAAGFAVHAQWRPDRRDHELAILIASLSGTTHH